MSEAVAMSRLLTLVEEVSASLMMPGSSSQPASCLAPPGPGDLLGWLGEVLGLAET